MKKLFLLLLIAPVLGFGQSDWYNHKHKVILMDKDYNVLYQNFSDQIKKAMRHQEIRNIILDGALMTILLFY